jgi:precorrin-6B methylase 2
MKLKKIVNGLANKFGYTLVKIEKANADIYLPVINKGKAIINKISPDFTVLNGPFRGMKYPSIDITELTLAPKISGSYEGHLTPLIDELIKTPYENIIDVGCAEGYYAIGFAKRIPGSTVHAYDVNEKDLEFCKKMAELNGTPNVTYNNFCSPETLINFNYGSRSLIFCDCEGYELDLFTPKVIKALTKTDVLIELHDVINPVISETLLTRFRDTHDVRVINNSNVDTSRLQGLDNITPAERAFAVYEHRGGLYQNIFMEWAFFTPKK